MKRLERIYKPNSLIKNNNKQKCIINNKNDNIKGIIEEVFKDKYPFYKKVYIKTNDKEYRTYLLKKDEEKIKTINDIEIKYNQIEEIKII